MTRASLVFALVLGLCASCKRPATTGANHVFMDPDRACAELKTGKYACWGPGPPAVVDKAAAVVANVDRGEAPAAVPHEAKQVVHGRAHSCVLMRSGAVQCMGDDTFGQLGDGTRNASTTPVPVHGIEEVAELAAGAHHTCALQKSGLVACWGKNDRHQLANGTTETSSHPVPVVGLVGVWEIAAAGDATCVLMGEGGDLRCWGANDAGQLGDARKPDHEVPVSVILPR